MVRRVTHGARRHVGGPKPRGATTAASDQKQRLVAAAPGLRRELRLRWAVRPRPHDPGQQQQHLIQINAFFYVQ